MGHGITSIYPNVRPLNMPQDGAHRSPSVQSAGPFVAPLVNHQLLLPGLNDESLDNVGSPGSIRICAERSVRYNAIGLATHRLSVRISVIMFRAGSAIGHTSPTHRDDMNRISTTLQRSSIVAPLEHPALAGIWFPSTLYAFYSGHFDLDMYGEDRL